MAERGDSNRPISQGATSDASEGVSDDQRSDTNGIEDISSNDEEINGEWEQVESRNRKKKEKRKNKVEQVNRSANPGPGTENKVDSYHLHFLSDCQLTPKEKRNWIDKIKAETKQNIGLINGNRRIFVVVETLELLESLVTEGFEGIKLEKPADNYTKVIIKNFPLYADPDIFLENNNVLWVNRFEKNGKDTRHVIAGITGPVPERLADYPNCWTSRYYQVEKYDEPPIICYRCSKWNHYAADCLNREKCRFCGEGHDSRICGDKLKNGQTVTKKCANCGEGHYASSNECEFHPRRQDAVGPPSYPSKAVPPPPAKAFPPPPAKAYPPPPIMDNNLPSTSHSSVRIKDRARDPWVKIPAVNPPSPVTTPTDSHELKELMTVITELREEITKLKKEKQEEKIAQDKIVQNLQTVVKEQEKMLQNMNEIIKTNATKPNSLEEKISLMINEQVNVTKKMEVIEEECNNIKQEVNKLNFESVCDDSSCDCTSTSLIQLKNVVNEVKNNKSLMPRGMNNVAVKEKLTNLQRVNKPDLEIKYMRKVYHTRMAGFSLLEMTKQLNEDRNESEND